jgi:hypothetical protein
VTIATGQWVFVAITVDRDSTTGIRWYVNGQPAGTPGNPTVRPGSLANSAPLLIGKHLNNASAFFAGSLDEIELFHRVLLPEEAQALFVSPLGKCKTRVVQNWDIPICSNLPTTSAQPQICNDSTEPRSFGVTLAGSPAGPGCSVAGPTTFTVGIAQPVLVSPSSCVSVPITITRPAGLGVGQTACFEIRAEDLATGQVASKKTSIWNTGAICCLPVSPTTAVPRDRSIPVRFNVQNLGNTPRTVNFELQPMPSDPAREVVSLDGLPAGEPVRGQVQVPARRTAQIETGVELLDFLPFTQQDLLLVDRDTNAVLASTALSSFAPGCTPDATTLCLNGGRFRVNAVWRDFAGNTGQGQAVPLTADTGYFWFFSAENIELVLKVLDGRPLNDQWWVFYGALSSVEYTVTVTDTVTGATRSYTNPPGRLASVADVSALPGDEPGSLVALAEGPVAEPVVELEPRAGNCAGGPTTLCLQQGRFRLEATWRTPNGASGAGMAVPLTNDSGYFWFFNSANVELVVKVLDGTPINQHWWLFYGALSDVDYTLTVTDTMTGASKTYRNPQGTLASVADVRALPQ